MKANSMDSPEHFPCETNPSSFTIRQFDIRDEAAVVALGEEADMGRLSGFENTEVAIENNTGEVLGFCRIRIFDNIAYVNPIVISKKAQGLGVGTALMKHCATIHGELRFVARGRAVPFYRSLGCIETNWTAIAHEVSGDCARCPSATSCSPLPMTLKTPDRLHF